MDCQTFKCVENVLSYMLKHIHWINLLEFHFCHKLCYLSDMDSIFYNELNYIAERGLCLTPANGQLTRIVPQNGPMALQNESPSSQGMTFVSNQLSEIGKKLDRLINFQEQITGIGIRRTEIGITCKVIILLLALSFNFLSHTCTL